MLDHQSGEFHSHADARIYYEVAGSRNGHPVILLHGGLGDLEDFRTIVGLFPDTLRFIAVDMRGHGRSTLGTKPLTYQQHQADIQSLITHLKLNEYSLLGFSDGGIVAYRIAAANPKVRSLITIGAQWRISQQDSSFKILSGVTPTGWSEMFPDAPQKYAALNPQGSFNELVESCVNLWTDLSPEGYPQKSISTISCPTLIVRGDGDFLLSLAEASEAQNLISGASFCNIPFAGHAAMEDSPDITGRIIHEFLLNPKKLQTEA